MSVPQFKVLTEEEALAAVKWGLDTGSRWDPALSAAMSAWVIIPLGEGETIKSTRAALFIAAERRHLRLVTRASKDKQAILVRATAVAP